MDFPYVPWLNYINMMLNPIKEMHDEDVIIVTVPRYFKKLENIITKTKKR